MSSSFFQALREQFAPGQPRATQAASAPAAGALIQGEMSIATPNGRLPAYHAKPVHSGPHPVILLAHDAGGLDAHAREVVQRLAGLGYLAIAAALFFRQGELLLGQAPMSHEKVEGLVEGHLPDAQVLSDLDACLAWATQAGGDLSRAGIIGFGWGGRIAWLYMAHQTQLRAAVVWYGRLSGATSVFQPRHPVDVAATLKAPVLGLYGGQDTWVSIEQVQQQHVQLRLNGGGSKLHVYANAPHGFFADDGKTYRRALAVDSWTRMQTWLQEHGVAPDTPVKDSRP